MAVCILVVDDELQSRETHAMALRSWGYEPVVAQNGFDALLKVAEHSPDLVISDLRMQECRVCRVLNFSPCSGGGIQRYQSSVLAVNMTRSTFNPMSSATRCYRREATNWLSLGPRLPNCCTGRIARRIRKDRKPWCGSPRAAMTTTLSRARIACVHSQ
jgi:CheY-like chemotaxis protein